VGKSAQRSQAVSSVPYVTLSLDDTDYEITDDPNYGLNHSFSYLDKQSAHRPRCSRPALSRRRQSRRGDRAPWLQDNADRSELGRLYSIRCCKFTFVSGENRSG